MNKKSPGMVSYQYDPENPPVLNAEEEAAWERLQMMRDEDIDLSDMPEVLTGWRRAVPRPADLVSEENQKQITLRLDA